MDGRGPLIRRSLLYKKEQMSSVCARRCALANQATFLKILHSGLISFSFVTDYKIHIQSDQNKKGNRQGLSPIVLRTV